MTTQPGASRAARTIAYGPHASQVGDLYLPEAPAAPVVCLLHGGFWKTPYGRQEMAGITVDLAARGFAVWNLEYRRLGESGGGWPGTFEDVTAGIDHLAKLVADGIALDLDRVIVAGHSAGGQLALLAVARGSAGELRGPSQVRPMAAAGLAAVVDLAAAFALDAGNGAVADFMRGSPQEHPERYAAASPIARLPLGVRQLIVHGTRDDALPVGMARAYASVAEAAGDRVEFIELLESGHMAFLDPASRAHAVLCAWLAACCQDAAGCGVEPTP